MVAMPDAFVVVFRPVAVPPPLAMANTTGVFGTGNPPASLTSTLGATLTAVPICALWRLPALYAMVAGAPGVRFTADDVTLSNPPPVNCSVRGPGAPVRVRPENVANPAALVLDVEDVIVPPPVAILTFTTTFGAETILPPASRNWIAGCGASATPLWALAAGCVVIDSAAAGPAANVTVPDVAGTTPGASN